LSPGARRYAVFGLAAIAFWLSFFHRVAPAAIFEHLMVTFRLTSGALGTLAATYFYIYTVMQIPTGILVDTLGPRRVLTAGGVVSSAGALLFARAETFGIAALGRSLVGLGVSVAFISMLKLNAAWFEDRRFATVTGLSNVIGVTGGLVAAAPLAWIAASFSWRLAFVAVGALSAAVAAAIWIFVRDEPHNGDATHAPEANWRSALATVVRNRATWPGFWVTFGIMGSFLSFVGLWAVPYLVNVHRMTVLEATRHTSLMIVAQALAGAALTSLSDRIGLRRPPMIAAAASYFACWMLWLSIPYWPYWPSWPGVTYVLSVALGACASCFLLSWVCAKEVNPPPYDGIAMSVVNMGGFLAVGILQPAVGWIVDQGGRDAGAYRAGILLLAACAALGFVATLFGSETRCRNVWVPREGEGAPCPP
jgi:predicted MFS family arabinose efflux permease